MSKESAETDPTGVIIEIAEECLAHKSRMLSRMITRIFDEALRPHGITISQLNMLVAISKAGTVRPVDLGRKLMIEKSTLSRNLARLREHKLVRPGAAAETPGRQSVRISRSGAALIRRAAPAWSTAQARVSGLIGGQGRKHLEGMLKGLRDDLI